MKTLSQSPTDPGFVQDPYPFYARARATGPLIFWSDYAMPVATTHAAVNALLRDRRFGREPVTPREIPDHLAPFYAVEAHSMLELEPPRHTRLRSPGPARLHQPPDQGAGARDRGADP
jgi:cytochrome P450